MYYVYERTSSETDSIRILSRCRTPLGLERAYNRHVAEYRRLYGHNTIFPARPGVFWLDDAQDVPSRLTKIDLEDQRVAQEALSAVEEQRRLREYRREQRLYPFGR